MSRLGLFRVDIDPNMAEELRIAGLLVAPITWSIRNELVRVKDVYTFDES